jgi:hypothetical protein
VGGALLRSTHICLWFGCIDIVYATIMNMPGSSIGSELEPCRRKLAMKDKETMLSLMRFWLFGTFTIIFAATTVYIGGAIGTGLLIFQQFFFWLAFAITAILCVLWYYIYKWYLDRTM